VLSGGGTRGAYEVGVVSGIMEALGQRAGDLPLFNVFAGTSVGAINATFLASHSHLGDHGISRLIDTWSSLRLEDHARLRPLGLVRFPRRLRSSVGEILALDKQGSSLLDARRLERVVERAIDWKRLHDHVARGVVSALLIAALRVETGHTTIFAELEPSSPFRGTLNPRRTAVRSQIELDHVLASAAIPLLFPSRRIANAYYCDGGLRFNTPVAPAIRAGATRLVVVSVMYQGDGGPPSTVPPSEARDLGPAFLLGKLLNALLLDPINYDLQVLQRFNSLVEVLEDALGPEDLERVHEVMRRTRGAPYRRIRTLVFRPSQNLGALAGEYLRTSLRWTELGPVVRRLLERAGRDAPGREADWASYLLFDGGYAQQLIELGRADALSMADQIAAFFSP
jgi:NTE family protein